MLLIFERKVYLFVHSIEKTMANDTSTLEPAAVWNYFSEITTVPRPSKKEERILQYLKDFAQRNGLEYKQDTAGNLLIIRPASAGKEHLPAVVLQSHVDMVCEKNTDTKFDFEHDPIEAYLEGGWMKARCTTLGADCGIGMAAEMAVLADRELKLPRIEGLFTVDEETGLTGAFNIAENLLTGKYLINLDSEDEGEIFIGCAGGIDTVAVFPFEKQPVPEGNIVLEINIKGLCGGHSGDDIHRSLGNANRLLARFLFEAVRTYALTLHSIDGGNLRNAIPREAKAVVSIAVDEKEALTDAFGKYAETVKQEYYRTEPGMSLTISETRPVEWVMDRNSAVSLLRALFICPNGVEAMSQGMPDMVETSTNLASVKMTGDSITVSTSQRSSLESKKAFLAAVMRTVFELNGAAVTQSDGYPGWEPQPDSHLLNITRKAYKELFGREPAIKSIHAGLECGLFLKKYPLLEMVSFGPTVKGVHSPDERLEVGTVKMFYDLLVRTLESI